MHKYNAKKVEYDGYKFDSKAEYDRYMYLKQQDGIMGLEVHPRYVLQEKYKYFDENVRAIEYTADFAYFSEDRQSIVVEDVKGMATPEAKLKRKMFIKKYCVTPDDICYELDWIVKAPKWTGVDWIDYFELEKLRKKRKKVK